MDGPIPDPEKGREAITSLSGVFLRLWWCFLGPAILGLLALSVAMSGDGWVSTSDLVYLVVLPSTVGARWRSFRQGDRTNALGEVVTAERLRHYSMTFLIGGLLVWIVANVVGNYLVSRSS